VCLQWVARISILFFNQNYIIFGAKLQVQNLRISHIRQKISPRKKEDYMGKIVLVGATKDRICKAMNALSIFKHDPRGSVAMAYESLVSEVLRDG
jgi:hypothetical protein